MRKALIAAGLLEVGALAAMGWVPGWRATPAPALALWGVAWIGHLWAWRALAAGPDLRPGGSVGDGPPGTRTPSHRTVLWTMGIVGRLALLPLLPHFSEDLWRYLWDGHVALQGVNPFLHAPVDGALDPIATDWRPRINHPDVPTIYPPGAQAVFTALALLGPSAIVYKAAWLAADLGVAHLIDRLARTRGDRSGVPLLLWLWSPLVLVEVAWSGHLEPLGLLPMMAALLWLVQGAGHVPIGDGGRDAGVEGAGRSGRHGLAAGGLLGLSAAVKFAPLAAVPALARRRGARAAAAAVAVPLLLYLPYSGAGAALFQGLAEYAARWRFNAALFPVLELVAGEAARPVVALLVASVAAVAAACRWTVARTLFWCIGAGLLLSPTIHPWYALWILPLAAVRRSVPWVAWTAFLFLAYAGRDAYAATGTWPHPPALAALVHAPLLLLLGAEALRRLGVLPEAGDGGGEEAGGEEGVEGGAGQ